MRGTRVVSARPAAGWAAAPAVTLTLLASCSAAGQVAGWCGVAERVVELETGGRDRIVVESPAAVELADAYEALVAAAPAPLTADAAVMRDFTASIRAELEAGASSVDVIDRAARDVDVDVSAVESAHRRLIDAVGEECGR